MLHINERSYLCNKLKEADIGKFDENWNLSASLDESQYKYLLKLWYQDDLKELEQQLNILKGYYGSN